ncbi:MAG: hypothetical protein PHQ05_10100 [Sterolibacterium sp.]|nr:hypothetical protein [Sterolibacterium sp.]
MDKIEHPPSWGAKPLHIFAPGRHVAMSGAVLDFSAADLAASAQAYDPAKHEAPIVVGHPRTDAPAYGWVKSLTAQGNNGGLEAEPHQVNPAFAELVAQGAYKKISASFYSPDSPQNPVPGVYYLRHVGFLGAQPPAVKGLRSPEFADAEEGVVEFGDWADQQNASLWRRLRDWFIADHGLDKADSIIPDYAVATLEDDARQPSVEATAAPLFSEANHQESQVNPEQAAAIEAENATLKQQLEASAARDKAAATATRHATNVAFAEALVAAGQLLPAQSAVAIATLDHLAGQESVVEFGEGDAKQPLADAFKGLLSALPKQIEFAETATKQKAGGATVDLNDANAIAAQAVEFQEAEAKAGRVITATAAVAHITAQK